MGRELQVTATFSIPTTEFFVIMSQGLIQVRNHRDNHYWAPKSRNPNSNKGEREKKRASNKREKKR